MCIINKTPEIHFRRTTTLTPEQFVAGLTDFGPGRSKLFNNSADEYLKVHYFGRSEADVTEGSLGIWERLYYDWSDPKRVVLTTIDSNIWGGTSGYTYALTRQPNGTTDIEVAVVREGKNFKGWVLGFVLRTIGRHVLKKAFEDSIKAIEARNGFGNLTNHQIELTITNQERGAAENEAQHTQCQRGSPYHCQQAQREQYCAFAWSPERRFLASPSRSTNGAAASTVAGGCHR